MMNSSVSDSALIRAAHTHTRRKSVAMCSSFELWNSHPRGPAERSCVSLGVTCCARVLLSCVARGVHARTWHIRAPAIGLVQRGSYRTSAPRRGAKRVVAAALRVVRAPRHQHYSLSTYSPLRPFIAKDTRRTLWTCRCKSPTPRALGVMSQIAPPRGRQKRGAESSARARCLCGGVGRGVSANTCRVGSRRPLGNG